MGGLVDTLKNSGIQRRDMIISSYDEEKFESMSTDASAVIPAIMSDQDDPGQLKAFVEGVKNLHGDEGIVVSVRAAKRKAEEVKSVMEQSGAVDIVVDDQKVE